MAVIKISQLDEATTVANTDLLEISQDNGGTGVGPWTSKKITKKTLQSSVTGSAMSTGVLSYTGMTIASSTTVAIPAVIGQIVSNTGANASNPIIYNVSYAGNPSWTPTYLLTHDATYVLLDNASNLYTTNTEPTAVERRNYIFIGKIAHPSHSTILNINNLCDHIQSPMSTLRDMFSSMRLINNGCYVSPNGANLTVNLSSGALFGTGINFASSPTDPNQIDISSASPKSFYYRTQLGGATGLVSSIDPTQYDNAGTIAPVSTSGDGGAHRSTNQYIYLYPTGVINIQYGQHVYDSLALALAGQQSETFIRCPNVATTAILIGILAVRRATTDLSNSTYAVFTPASMFGENIGGVNGISTTTLQQAYDNSVTPEIMSDATRGPLTIKEGTGTETSACFDVLNNSNVNTYKVLGNGCVVIPKTSGIGVKIDVDTPEFGWKDLIGQIVPRPSGGPAPALGIFLTGAGGTPKIQTYAFNSNDVIDNIVFHIPHDYVPGTDMFLHLHWGHNGTAIAGSFVIAWAATYAKGYSQSVFSPEIAITQTISTPNIATIPRWQHRIDEFQLTNNGGDSTHLNRNLIEVDGLLIVSLTVTTIPTITGGTPNNPYIFMADIHYQSTQMATKGRNYPFYT